MMQAVKTPSGLNDALDEMTDPLSEIPIERRFDDLMQEMIAFALYMIDRQRKTGKRMEDHEREFQEDSMKQLRHIEQVLKMAKKYNRLSTSPNPQFEEQTIDKFKNMQSLVGDIVQKVPKNNEPAK